MRCTRWLQASVLGIVISLMLLSLVGSPAWSAKKQITVWLWDSHNTPSWKEWLGYVKESFEKKHPGVQVQIDLVPWGADKLTVAIAGGAVPDVSIASIVYARDIFEAGGLMSLNRYIESTPEVAPDRMLPFTQVYNQLGGEVYGATLSAEANCIVYNVDMVEDAGLDATPLAMATWKDFLQYATKLTKKGSDGKIKCIGYAQWLGLEPFAGWLYSNGGSFYNKDLTKADFNTSRGVETLSFLRDLIYNYGVSGWTYEGYSLEKGTAAMSYMGTIPLHLSENRPDLNFRITSFPVGPSGTKRSSVGWGQMYVIPKGAKNPDLGWDYIAHYLSMESQLKQLDIPGTPLSPRKDLYNANAWRDKVKQNPWLAMVPHIFEVAGVNPFIRFTTIWPKLSPVLNKALQFEMPPQEALSRMETIVNQGFGKR